MSEHAEEKYEEFRETFLKIQQEVSKQIVGQKEIIEGGSDMSHDGWSCVVRRCPWLG